MEQNQGFFQKNWTYLLAGIIVVVAIGFAASQMQTPEENDEDVLGEQANGEEVDANGPVDNDLENQNETTKPTDQNQTTTEGIAGTVGNVSAQGTLLLSDNPDRGNLMLDSNMGKIYVQTGRDFSGQIDHEVVLDADGTLETFVFLNFLSPTETVDRPPVVETPPAVDPVDQPEDGMLTLSGRLEASDNLDRGKYLIIADEGRIYLMTQRDYSAWIGQEVELSATGTIHSFTGAVLTRK